MIHSEGQKPCHGQSYARSALQYSVRLQIYLGVALVILCDDNESLGLALSLSLYLCLIKYAAINRKVSQ